MYEQVYFSQEFNRAEQEQIARAAERRRFLREHADQIVPRPAGAFRRMVSRITGGADAAPRPADQVAPITRSGTLRPATARQVDDCVAVGCEPVGAAAR